MSDFDFSDINLDFLQSTPPKRQQGNQRIDTPTIKSELDIGPRVVGGKNVKSKKLSEWAKRIAKVDELISEIKILKCEKLELQTQLKEFQKSALNIQTLYATEKKASDMMSKDIKLLQEKFERADADLTVKNLKCDQLEGQLAIHKDRPVDYNVMVVKYLRLLYKLEEEENLRNGSDRLMIDNLRQYCAKHKLKTPTAAGPKQSKSRRLQKEDAAVQCELLKEKPVVAKPAMKSQSTQCQTEMRNQGSQHISTMTTRGTTTACFIKYRTVGTSFPESQPIAAVDDILREFAPWQNITPISPLIDQPAVSGRSGQDVTKIYKSTGTCTWLCNIRRIIDFVPRNKQQRPQNARPSSSCDVSTSQSIKQELTTPSPSPTPNVQATVESNQNNNNATASQSTTSAITPNQNTVSNPLFAALQTSLPLRHLSGSSFDDLWQIFGRMLLGLLHTSNAGIATNASATNQEAVNQHQFYSWLREIYESSVAASGNNGPEQSETITAHNVATSPINTPDTHTLVPEHSEIMATHSVATSPLRFNQISPFGSPNIIRPQPRRSYLGEDSAKPEDIHQEDDLRRDVHLNDILADNFNSESNSTTPSDNESHHRNLNKETLTSFGSPEKPPKRRKKHNILNEIQELFPEAKLCKSKRKALKRLLKSEKKNRKDKERQGTAIESIPLNNLNNFSNNVGHEETAVDFLKGIFESSNATSHNYTIGETREVRGVNRHKDTPQLCGNGIDRVNHEVKDSIEIVKVENVRNYKMKTNTNCEENSSHRIPANKIHQFNNTIGLNIDDSVNFKKPKNVNKNISFPKSKRLLCKNSKISNKQELYTSLFGDSDTEMDDIEDALKVCNGNEKENVTFANVNLRKKSNISELQTSGDKDELKSCRSSQNINYSDEDYSEDHMEVSPNKNSTNNRLEISEPHVRFSETEESKYDDKPTSFSHNIHLSDEEYSEDDMEVTQLQNTSNISQICEPNISCSETEGKQCDVNISNQDIIENIVDKCESSANNSDRNSCDSEVDDSLDNHENFNRSLEGNVTFAATENFSNHLEFNAVPSIRFTQHSENKDRNGNGTDILFRGDIRDYPFENLLSCSRAVNTIQNSKVSETSVSGDKLENNMGAPQSRSHHFEEDLHAGSSQSHNIPIVDMCKPVLKGTEISLINEDSTNFLFGQMDKETQNRLETIIDKQLKDIPANIEEDTIAAPEDIPSDFEKDFELSSDEDDILVTEKAFLVLKEVATDEMCTENLQCRASSVLENGCNIITSKVDDFKATSEDHNNCNTSRMTSANPIVSVINGVSENFKYFDFKGTKNFTLRKDFHDIEDLKLKNSKNVSNTFNAKYRYETNCNKDLKSLETNNPATNSCDNHVDIVLKNNNTFMINDLTALSTSPPKCSLAPTLNTSQQSDSESLKPNNPTVNSCNNHVLPAEVSSSPINCTLISVFDTSIESEENTSITQSDEKSIIIEVSSDITSVETTANKNKLSIHESPGDNIYEKVQTTKFQQNMIEAASNCGEISNYLSDNVKNSEDHKESYYFPLGKSESKDNISRLSTKEKIENSDWIMEEITRNKTSDIIPVDVKISTHMLKSTNSSNKNCVLKCPPSFPAKPFNVLLELNSIQQPNALLDSAGCQENTLASSTDEEISVINISTDNTSIENERRDITSTPNDELIIDDSADDTEEEKQDSRQKPKNPDKNKTLHFSNTCQTNENLEIPQECQNLSIEINFDTGNTKKMAELSVQNSIDNLNTTTEISSLLSSTLYKDILSDSILPLVDDVLRDDDLMKKTSTPDKKPQTRGRKRKSECQLEEQPPCKRSERLRARKNNLSITPVEIGKYTRINRNSISDLKSKRVEKVVEKDEVDTKENEVNFDIPVVAMGFFREINDSKSEERSKTECPLTSLQGKSNEEAITGAKSNHDSSNNLETLIVNDLSSSLLSASTPLSINTSLTCLQQKSTEILKIHEDDESIKNYPQIAESSTEETVATCKMQGRQTALNNSSTTNLKQKQTAFHYSESPLSPPPQENTIDTILDSATFEIPLELSPQCRPKAQTNSLLDNLMSHFSPVLFNRIAAANSQTDDNLTKRERVIAAQYEKALNDYCCSAMNLDPDIMASKIMVTLQQQYSIDYPLLCCVILKLAKNAKMSMVVEKELPSIIQEMPPRHLCLSLQRLFYLLKHLTGINSTFCIDLVKKIDFTLFNIQQSEKLTLNSSLHLIQLYLMSCKFIEHKLSQHPARILLAKCLYFYAIKSISMIHEVLMWYPTVMPPKEDRTYDRSDALITVIQQMLMATKYDMDNADVRGKCLLSKLRFEYHYIPFKPSLDETICNLVEKLKMSKFCNLSLAFSLLCKRMAPPRAENLLQTHILPLANEYFNLALKNTEFDERISVILDIISKVVKPFPSDWDVEIYLNLFSRFLSNFNRAFIQESAVCSIIRLQRFGYVNCFHRLISFKPTFELSSAAQAMLKTFIHRKPLHFLNKITNQSHVNFG